MGGKIPGLGLRSLLPLLVLLGDCSGLYSLEAESSSPAGEGGFLQGSHSQLNRIIRLEVDRMPPFVFAWSSQDKGVF